MAVRGPSGQGFSGSSSLSNGCTARVALKNGLLLSEAALISAKWSPLMFVPHSHCAVCSLGYEVLLHRCPQRGLLALRVPVIQELIKPITVQQDSMRMWVRD